MKAPIDQEIAEIISNLDNASTLTKAILDKSKDSESGSEEFTVEFKDGVFITLSPIDYSENITEPISM